MGLNEMLKYIRHKELGQTRGFRRGPIVRFPRRSRRDEEINPVGFSTRSNAELRGKRAVGGPDLVRNAG